jgi:hypothetical protein
MVFPNKLDSHFRGNDRIWKLRDKSTVVSFCNKTAHLPRSAEKAGGHVVPVCFAAQRFTIPTRK